MDVSLHFNKSGGRSSDGGVKIVARKVENDYVYDVMKLDSKGREELVHTIKFEDRR